MSDSFSLKDQIKLFGVQNIMLESSLLRLEKDGINIGRSQELGDGKLVDPELFELDIRTEAKKMADFYVLYFCLENTIRRLITERLQEKHGAGWWIQQIPQGIRDEVAKRQKEEKEKAIYVRADDPLAYVSFGEFITIFESNWTDFSDTIRSRQQMKQILGQFNQLRNVIAHSCTLDDDEITRFKLLIGDWTKIQS